MTLASKYNKSVIFEHNIVSILFQNGMTIIPDYFMHQYVQRIRLQTLISL